MKGEIAFFVLLAWFPAASFAVDNLCTKFMPSANLQFVDTYSQNYLTVLNIGNKLTGTFQHIFGPNNQPVGNIIAGVCTGNQMSFSWRNSNGSFFGSFNGTLYCVNSVFNLNNIVVTINGASSYIAAMSYPHYGPCPT